MNLNDDLLKNETSDDQNPIIGFANINFRKYLKLILKRRYWIISMTVFISVIWIILASLFFGKLEYTSEAMIRFNDPRAVSAVTVFTNINTNSKLAILDTRSFLGRVVDSLNYNLQFESPQINPAKLIRNAEISSESEHGEYKIVNIDSTLEIYYTNEKEGVINQNIQIIPFTYDSIITLNTNGLKIDFNAQEVYAYNKIVFEYVQSKYSINKLKSNLKRQLDRSQTILTISYQDKNPEYCALVVNTIANLFVQQSLDFKRIQTTSILSSLEEQLEAARRKLDNAEDSLKKFRRVNPLVYLESDRRQMVSQYVYLENDVDTKSESIIDLNKLIKKSKTSAQEEDKIFIYQDILTFLQSINVPGSALLIQRYNQLINERQRLASQNYPSGHPQVVNIEKQIQEIEAQIDQKANQHYSELRSDVRKSKRDINDLYENLKNLPRNELRLAELERNRLIQERIVSSIMSRIEEAKVEDASIIPDAYLIDRAEPPVLMGGLLLRVKKYGPGPILGFILGIVLIFVMDFFDSSARDAKDVEKILKIPMLVTIPVIKNLKEVPEEEQLEKKLDDKLITSDYSPNLASETFRLLRTKLNIITNEKTKAFILTSLNPGEGKSLIASNLAITFAQQKLSTLLIDCDLRRGVLHNSFNCKKYPGLTDILIRDREVDMRVVSKILQNTHIPNLSLLSSGKQIPNPSELLGSSRMESLYKKFKKKYKVIIFDTPPLEFIPDAFALNNFVHSIILLVKYGKTNLNRTGDLLSDFKIFKKDFKGVVVNAAPVINERKYHSYSYYNY